MKLGLCWVNNEQSEINSIITELNDQITLNNLSENVFLFSFFEHEKTKYLSCKKNNNETEFVHDIIYNLVNNENLKTFDFCFLTFGNSFPLDLNKFFSFCNNNFYNKDFFISTRVFKIKIIAERFPARFPYTDDHFVILNLSKSYSIASKLSNIKYHVHLGHNKAYNLQLLSLFESCFNEKEALILKNDVFNIYDEKILYEPYQFSLCKKSSIVTYYKSLNSKKVNKFIQNNLRNTIFIYSNRNIFYLLYFFLIKKIKKIFSINNFAFQKNY